MPHLSPELAEATALCRQHEYFGNLLDPAVTPLRNLAAAYPQLDLAMNVRRAIATLTPERLERQLRKHGTAARFLTSFFEIAERQRVRPDTGAGGGEDMAARSLRVAKEHERLDREATARDLKALRAEGGRP